MKEVDLFVIGAGSDRVRAARVAASYGASCATATTMMLLGDAKKMAESIVKDV